MKYRAVIQEAGKIIENFSFKMKIRNLYWMFFYVLTSQPVP